MGASELAGLRETLASLDAQIIALLSERVAIARRVGVHKRAHGLATLDPKREAEVVTAAGRVARDHGLPEEEVREIFWQVIAMSRRAQETAP